MIDVIIIGSGGLARECHELLMDMVRTAPGLEQVYHFRGFVRWEGERVSPRGAHPFLGDAASFSIGVRDMFVIGLAEPGEHLQGLEVLQVLKEHHIPLIPRGNGADVP